MELQPLMNQMLQGMRLPNGDRSADVTGIESAPARRPARQLAVAPVSDGPGVGFEVDHRPSGLSVTRLVDKRTGDVILQLPPEGVLRQVSAMIEALRSREA